MRDGFGIDLTVIIGFLWVPGTQAENRWQQRWKMWRKKKSFCPEEDCSTTFLVRPVPNLNV